MKADQILDQMLEALFGWMIGSHQQRLVEAELTLIQEQALRLLGKAPRTTGSLSASLGITPPAVTQLTDRLVRKQLILRRAGEMDRRSVTVELTVKGRRLIDDLKVRRNDVFEAILVQLRPSERDEVLAVLLKITRLMGADLKDELAAEQSKPTGLSKPQKRPRPRRTAVRPPSTSKILEREDEIAEQPKPAPPRRMRIEWD